MQPWRRIEPTVVHQVGWRTITSKTFVLPNGETSVFDTIHHDGQRFVSVIALTDDNQVLIARQFRPGFEMVNDKLRMIGGF